MQFDDRLATVLRSRIASEQAARTQYLQLLDLLGTAPPDARSPAIDQAYLRLDDLDEMIDSRERAGLVRMSGDRLRDPRVVYRLSQCEPAVVSATMSGAQLSDSDWLDLIPQLPISARGFLRNGDHSPAVKDMLSRLGVGDMVLPDGEQSDPTEGFGSENLSDPENSGEEAEAITEDTDVGDDKGLGLAAGAGTGAIAGAVANTQSGKSPNSEIGEIVRKIEAYRQAKSEADETRRAATNDPRLPLGDRDTAYAQIETRAFDFSTDANGKVIWADPGIAPMVYGMVFLDRRSNAPAKPDRATLEKLRRQQPVRAGTIELSAAPAISGVWQIDAAPHFSRLTGAYAGYLGRLRRIPDVSADEAVTPTTADEPNDRIRQLLHELRTPVNAIQGFAEVIQQQLFGPTPHEYRALSANIAGDAAHMLAGFEEIDRLAQLDSGAAQLTAGESDVLEMTIRSLAQVEPVLGARQAGFSFSKGKGPFLVAVDGEELERLFWRVFAALSASLAQNEQARCTLYTTQNSVRLRWTLPESLKDNGDVFQAAIHDKSQALLASTFGSGFALRLARAEAKAGGGALIREEDKLRLELPLLTEEEARHSDNS